MNKSTILGIIAEYNPFHTGHLYQLRLAKEISGAKYVIVLISGSFVQRGEPAIFDTCDRAKFALLSGADAVFEMPVHFSTASAESFAHFGVSTLSYLGADFISFGVEDASCKELGIMADILNSESAEYKKNLQLLLKQGLSFPKAREQALADELYSKAYSDKEIERFIHIIASSNNILGLEYFKAMKKISSKMQPVLIKRQGEGYNSNILINNSFASASALRKHILSGGDFKDVKEFIPAEIFSFMESLKPVSPDFLCSHIYRKLKYLKDEAVNLSIFSDISPDLSERIFNNISLTDSYENLVESIKSKQYTHTRISRCLAHIILNIKASDFHYQNAPYARLLGFKKSSKELLSILKQNSKIPIITKPASYKELLGDNSFAKKIMEKEVYANDIYSSLIFEKYKVKNKNLYTKPLVII